MTEIIAEIGVNANGSLDEAMALVDAAISAGASVVKFQATFPRVEMSARYMRERIEMTEKVILTHDQLKEIDGYCAQQEIESLFTPSEMRSLHWLIHEINPRRIKIGSDCITDIPLLELAASYDKPVILSTGMSTWEEIDRAYAVLTQALHPNDVTLMHCTSSYPCLAQDANLRCITTMRERYSSSPVGWSDHTTDAVSAALAVALGAEVIEKHITRANGQSGPDHNTSLTPAMFAHMVTLIHHAEKVLGSGDKQLRECERGNHGLLRKSVVARRAIDAGEKLDSENMICQRPGYGTPPVMLRTFVGMKACRNYAEGEMI